MIDEYLEMGEYQKALALLDDLEDEQVRYYRLICLYGLKDYQKGLKEAREAKALAKETYYDVLCYLVGFLKETENYEEAVDLLVEELSMPYIPFQYESRLNDLYDEILLEKREAYQELEAQKKIFSEKELAMLLEKGGSDDVMLMAIDQLTTANIRLFLPQIRLFLEDPARDSVLKTLLLLILKDQEVDEELTVVKHAHTIECNPIYLEDIEQSYWMEAIVSALEHVLENDNPSLLEMGVDLTQYFLHDWYPLFECLPDPEAIACAIHYHLAGLMLMEIELEDLCFDYGVEQEPVLDILEKVQNCQ